MSTEFGKDITTITEGFLKNTVGGDFIKILSKHLGFKDTYKELNPDLISKGEGMLKNMVGLDSIKTDTEIGINPIYLPSVAHEALTQNKTS